jgi:hypothetical protein
MSAADRLDVGQRCEQALPQETRTHGGARRIDEMEQRTLTLPRERGDQLQTAHRRIIE